MSANESKLNTKDGRRVRKRLRGMLQSRTGRTVGLASIAAPLVGFVIQDLKKPDSIIRELLGKATQKLLAARMKRKDTLDISDKVEIIESNNIQA